MPQGECRQLGAAFEDAVSAGDSSIAKAIRNLNAVTRDFFETFTAEVSLPSWSDLEAAGGTTRDHAVLDLAGAHQLIGRRIAELLWDFVDSLDRRRMLVATLTARATLETAALAVYCAEHVASALPPGDAADADMDALVAFLHRIIGGARFDWTRARGSTEDQLAMLRAFAQAKSAKDAPEPPDERKAINVLTMLGVLDRRVASVRGGYDAGLVRAVYSMLSDFCHPAIGSLILHVRPSPEGLEVHSAPADALVRYLFTSALGIVGPVATVARDALNEMFHQVARLEGRA